MTILWLVGFRWMLEFPWLLILVPCVGDLLAHLKFSVVDAKWIRRSNYIAFALGVSALKIHLEKLYGKKEKVSAAPGTFFSFSLTLSLLTIFCALFRLNYVVAFFFFFCYVIAFIGSWMHIYVLICNAALAIQSSSKQCWRVWSNCWTLYVYWPIVLYYLWRWPLNQ